MRARAHFPLHDTRTRRRIVGGYRKERSSSCYGPAGTKKILQNMASSSFRNSMSSLGWSRRETELPVSTNSTTPILSKLSSLNLFGRSGYVQLPTHEPPGAPLPAPSRREEEEGWFACEWPSLPYMLFYDPSSSVSSPACQH